VQRAPPLAREHWLLLRCRRLLVLALLLLCRRLVLILLRSCLPWRPAAPLGRDLSRGRLLLLKLARLLLCLLALPLQQRRLGGPPSLPLDRRPRILATCWLAAVDSSSRRGWAACV
jgi:hypothetical protein